MAELQVNNLTKSFRRGTAAVDTVSFRVRSGEILALTGPGGSGKSTVLRLLAGLEEADQGSIHLGDVRIDAIPPRERRVAMVFQEDALYPHLSLRENLRFGALVESGDFEERFEREVEEFELGPFLALRPKELGKFERAKAALAKSILRGADLLLFDEPLHGLDPRERHLLRTRLGMRRSTFGAPAVYATQDQAEAMTLSDQVAILEEGRIRQVGPAMDLYDDPADSRVASLLGAPPINLLDVQVAPDGAVILPGSDWALFLDTPRREVLRRSGLMEAKLGIRSQHLRIVGPDEPGWLAMVEWIEAVGNEVFVHCQLGGVTVVVRTRPGYAPPLGQAVAVQAHPSKSLVFHPQTHQRLV